MRPLTSLLTCGLLLTLIVLAGCAGNTRLETQRLYSEERIAELDREVQSLRDDNSRLRSEATGQKARAEGIQKEADLQKVEFDKFSAEFDAMAEKVGRTGPLPQELDAMLAALAQTNSDQLTYDPSKGRISLMSDLTFNLASDEVKTQAKPALDALAQICSNELAQNCQVLIVGHTDDVPIVHERTKARHPTNWHLSVHRAIAVMNVLKKSMPEDRLSVMGFGEFRPVADNAPNNQGNPLNRRVEIFIVPRDTEVPSAGLK